MRTVKCPCCGHKNKRGERLCEECGNRLAPDAGIWDPFAQQAPVAPVEEDPAFERPVNKASRIGLYTLVFLIFWFGFLIVFDTLALKSWSNGGMIAFLFSLLFWAAGIIALIQELRRTR
ncbi:MAG: zinc ribbon domain-containing protein [Clostridia bacterium]|nr:zinc ribbon domain-containing protein [Clostridia bacterium]